jgi:predicted 2-oxoglutarate/Fe(II)-dependent dioxygenase YbiX
MHASGRLMKGPLLTPIGPNVFQFPCLDKTEAEEILHQVRPLTMWQAGPVRKKSSGSSLREDVRLAWEIREGDAPEAFAGFEQTIRGRAAIVGAQLTVGDLEVSEMRLMRYDEGGYFKVHTDMAPGVRRRFAIVIYLNDDFEGGATVFPLLGCKSLPQQGKALVFPAERLHRGDVVTGGSKFILVLWLLDPEAPGA